MPALPAEACQRPRGVFAHERLWIGERVREQVYIAGVTNIAEYHGRVALQSAELGPFDRRALERDSKILIVHPDDVAREGPRISSCDPRARRERRIVFQYA